MGNAGTQILGLCLAALLSGTTALAQQKKYGTMCELKKPEEWKGKYTIIWTPDKRYKVGDKCVDELLMGDVPVEGLVQWVKLKGDITNAERDGALPSTGKAFLPSQG